MAVTRETANYLVRRWYMAELGRVPSASEQQFHAQIVVDKGPDAAFAGIYDSPQAKNFRTSTGRKV